MYKETFKELVNFGGQEFANKYILFFLPTPWAYSWERNLNVNHFTSKNEDNLTDLIKKPLIDDVLLHPISADNFSSVKGQILSAEARLNINGKIVNTFGYLVGKTIAYPIKKTFYKNLDEIMQSRLRKQINNASIQEQAKVYNQLKQNSQKTMSIQQINKNSRYEEMKRRRARKKSGSPIPGQQKSIDEKLGMKPRGTRKAEIAKEKFLNIEKINEEKKIKKGKSKS